MKRKENNKKIKKQYLIKEKQWLKLQLFISELYTFELDA